MSGYEQGIVDDFYFTVSQCAVTGHKYMYTNHTHGHRIYLNYLKWNYILMKIVKTNGENLAVTHQSLFLNSCFNSFKFSPKCWSALLKECGIHPRQPTSATMHFISQLEEP